MDAIWGMLRQNAGTNYIPEICGMQSYVPALDTCVCHNTYYMMPEWSTQITIIKSATVIIQSMYL